MARVKVVFDEAFFGPNGIRYRKSFGKAVEIDETLLATLPVNKKTGKPDGWRKVGSDYKAPEPPRAVTTFSEAIRAQGPDPEAVLQGATEPVPGQAPVAKTKRALSEQAKKFREELDAETKGKKE